MYIFDQLLQILGVFSAAIVIVYIGSFVLALAAYIFLGYGLECIGKKLGMSKTVMPYFPIAKQIYMCRMVDIPVWHVLFLGWSFITFFMVSLASLLIGIIFICTRAYVVGTVLEVIFLLVYFIIDIAVTYDYNAKLFGRFHINPLAAWVCFIPTAGYAVKFFMAFTNAFDKKESSASAAVHAAPEASRQSQAAAENDSDLLTMAVRSGKVTCIAGMYNTATFSVKEGAMLTFGRSNECNLVFDATCADISRVHARIEFRNGSYIVTDLSSNGTYLGDGTRLEPQKPTYLNAGTILYFGSSRRNGFKLG